MNFNLNKINLDLHRELNRAGEIISRDHFVRLESGKDVNGSRMTPLKDATIDRKGFNQILVDTGQMRNLVIERATKTNQVVEVHPGRKKVYKTKAKKKVTMADVGGYHQKGNKNLPKREWFGISENAEKRIMKHIQDKIWREVNSA